MSASAYKLPAARIALAAVISIIIAAAGIASGIFVKNFPPGIDELYPGMQAYTDFMPTFGLNTTLTVLAEDPAGFSTQGLADLDRLTKTLSEAEKDGIRHVRSLTNLPTIHPDADGEVETESLVKTLPTNRQELDELKKRVQADKNAVGAVISPDFSMYTLVVALSAKPDMKKISALIDANRGTLRIHLYGAPAIAADMRATLAESLPVAAVVLAVLLLVFLAAGYLLMPHHSAGRLALLVLFSLALTALWAGVTTVWGIGGFSAFPVALIAIVATVLHLLQGRIMARSALLKSLGAMMVSGILLIIVNGYLVRAIGISLLAAAALTLPFVVLITPHAVLIANDGPASGRRAIMFKQIQFAIVATGIILTVALASFLTITGNPSDMYRSAATRAAVEAMNRHNGGSQYIHVSLTNKRAKDPLTLEIAQVLYRYLVNHPHVADVRSPSAIFSDLNLNMNQILRIPITTGGVGDIGFFLDGNPDFEALATPDFTRMQVIATPQSGYEAEVVKDLRSFVESLRVIINNRGELLKKRYDLLLAAAKLPPGAIPQPAMDDVLKIPAMQHKAAARLYKALTANMMPVQPPEDITGKLAPLMALPETGFDEAYRKLAETFDGMQDFPEEFRPDYFSLVAQRRADIIRHLWAESVLERMSPDMYRTQTTLYQSLKGILVTIADPAFAKGLDTVKTESPVTLQVLGLPVIAFDVHNQTRSALVWTFFLILLPLVFFDQWRGGVGALLASVITLLSASVLSLAGIPSTPLAIMFVACMPAAAMVLNASTDNRQLYRYQAQLTIMGGVVFFATGLLLPFATDLFLTLGMVLAAMGGWMLLKMQIPANH